MADEKTEAPEASSSKRPTHALYSVRDRGPGQKAVWTEVGVGFTNKDGSLNLVFDAFPVGGRCTLREIKRDEA